MKTGRLLFAVDQVRIETDFTETSINLFNAGERSHDREHLVKQLTVLKGRMLIALGNIELALSGADIDP